MQQLIIAGCPRSGTTALRNLLNTQKDTFIANEMMLYSGSHDSFIERITGHWSDKFNKQCIKAEIDPVEFVDYVKDDKSQSIEFLKSKGFNIVGDKFPSYVLVNHHANMLRAISNGVKFIFCVRDCRDFVCSSLDHFKRGRSPQKNRWVFETIEDACGHWVKMNLGLQTLISQIPPTQYMIAQYETSVSNVPMLRNKISKLLNHEWYPDIMDTLEYYPVHIGRWKRECPEINIRLSAEASRLMELYGYQYD